MRGTNCRELATLTLSGMEVVTNEETRFFSFGIFSNNNYPLNSIRLGN